jgi:ribonuclease T2
MMDVHDGFTAPGADGEVAMKVRVCVAALAALLAWPGAAAAQHVSLEGYFIALSDCEANKKKDSDNPGDVRLEILRAYEILARNSTPGTHYQVKVPGAPVTEQRWVPMACGASAPEESLVRPTGNPPPPPPLPDGLEPDSIELVLAASWQPGFCATGRAGQNRLRDPDRRPARHDAVLHSRPVAG